MQFDGIIAVRRAVMTSVSQVTQQISELNAEEFGADGWEISAHSGARPSHAIYQGRQYPQADYERIVLPLIDDYNCRHSAFPIIMGVTPPSYTEEELKNIDPPPFVYEGRRYTAYEAQQQMRFMERKMRKQKDLCIAANAAGDKEAFTAHSIKLRRQKDLYENFCEAAGTYTEYERTVVMGYDRHLSGKTGAVTRKNRAFERAQIQLESDVGDKIKLTTKSVFAKNKVFPYDDLDISVKQSFESGLTQATPNVREVLNAVKNTTDYTYSKKKKSFYNSLVNYVSIRKDAPSGTLAHELFHRIDRFSKISTNAKNGFYTALQTDWTNLIKMSGGDVVSYLITNYSEAFTINARGKIVLKEQYRGISDIISGLSDDKINLGYHHSADYWSVKGNLERESWAQFGRTFYDNDPHAVKMFNEIFTTFNERAIIALKGAI